LGHGKPGLRFTTLRRARLVRNFAVTGRRKLPGKPVYINIEPEMVKLEEVLAELSLTREQLIDVGILLGTDFNPEGFEGIGPKKALKIIKEAGSLKAAFERAWPSRRLASTTMR